MVIYGYTFRLLFFSGVNSRGLEYRTIPRDEKDKSLGGSILRGLDDLWQLRPFQPACRHPRGGIFKSGITKNASFIFSSTPLTPLDS